jgi:Tol biopolymer transport system component
MKHFRPLLAVLPLPALLLLAATRSVQPAAQTPKQPAPVSYTRQILPLFEKQCNVCHSGSAPASGYAMTTREALLKGGRHGVAIVPGKSNEGTFVKYLTGELKPKMPPGGALDLDTINLIRRWINEGAKFDSPTGGRPGAGGGKIVPAAPAAVNGAAQQPAPVTALAYSPDGKRLAAGGYRVVRLLDAQTGQVVRKLSGPVDQVQAVAWSSDGKRLAVAGGAAGLEGEVLVYDTLTWLPLRKLAEHYEVVYALAWKPNTHELATGSFDKTARVWDADTGKVVKVLKTTPDAVMGVAYSPDGKMLATASLDRSAKLIDTTTWKRLAALTAHQDGLTRVAFNHDGTLLATAGTDKTVRLWKVEIGKMENPLRTHNAGDTITACAFSNGGGDNSLFVYGSADTVVRAFNGDATQHRRDLRDGKDWVYSVALSPDSRTIAAGTHDGKVLFWNAADEMKLVRAVSLLPGGGAKVEIATSKEAGK